VQKKKFCKVFFLERINIFALELVNHIPFNKFMERYLQRKPKARFCDLKTVCLELFSTVQQ
jgi:hypothetical protein